MSTIRLFPGFSRGGQAGDRSKHPKCPPERQYPRNTPISGNRGFQVREAIFPFIAIPAGKHEEYPSTGRLRTMRVGFPEAGDAAVLASGTGTPFLQNQILMLHGLFVPNPFLLAAFVHLFIYSARRISPGFLWVCATRPGRCGAVRAQVLLSS